jgi:DtxR family Mn-dependent transcriptional regulator
MPRKAPRDESMQDEMLFFEESHDHAEEYLEALAMLEQQGKLLPGVSDVARMLHIKAPSAVQMLKRLAQRGLVEYLERQGVRLTPKGRKIGLRMVRNGRLMELFMTKELRLPLDLKVAHSIEHSMSEAFADALCTRMKHPEACPHDHPIPAGACCPAAPSARKGHRRARVP